MPRSILFVLLGVFGVSPVFGQSAAERQLAADIRMLEQRTDRIESAISELAQAAQGLSKQLSEQANATRKLSADQMVVLEDALTTVRVLREQLAETNQRLAAILGKINCTGWCDRPVRERQSRLHGRTLRAGGEGIHCVLECLTSGE